MLTVVPDVPAALPADGPSSSLIDQIVREGARQMLAAALQAEVTAYIDQFADVRGENGRRLVVRNGTAEPRTVLTSAGAVEVTAPRVNDRLTDPATGVRMRFSSAILPPRPRYSRLGTCPAWTTCTCGWTASTWASGWRRTSCACW